MSQLETICENCRGSNDVTTFNIGEAEHTLCLDCRVKILGSLPRNRGARVPGRPSLGLTKKISLTLPKETWEWFDEAAEGNRSELLRRLVIREMKSQSNNSPVTARN